MSLRVWFGLLAVSVVAGSLASSASASTVDLTGTTLKITAASGEINQFYIYRSGIDDSGEVRVEDRTEGPPEGTGKCHRVGGGSRDVLCDASDITTIEIALGNKDDVLRFSKSYYDTLDTSVLYEMPLLERVTVKAGDGDDDIYIPGHAKTVSGEGGADELRVGTTISGPSISGGDGSDTITVANLDSGTVAGEAGRDHIVVYHGDGGSISGGDDGDSIDASSDGATVNGDDGGDLISVSESVGSNMIVNGGEGTDNIAAGDEDDVISGQSDGDILNGGGGNNRIYGGEDDDYLAGEDGVDYLYGGSGNDRLFGQAGADYLDGGDDSADYDGDDTLNGGEDNDVVTYSSRLSSLNLSLNGAKDDGQSGESDDIESVEELIAGSGDDVVDIHDGETQDLDCGSGVDTVTADGTIREPQDRLAADCETAKYPDTLSSSTGPIGGGFYVPGSPEVASDTGGIDPTAEVGPSASSLSADSIPTEGSTTGSTKGAGAVSVTSGSVKSAKLKILSKKLRRAKGYVRVKMRWMSPAGATKCVGYLKLKRGRKVLGYKRFNVAPNKNFTVRVKVKSAAVKAAIYKRGAKIKVSASAKSASTSASTSSTLMLRPARS